MHDDIELDGVEPEPSTASIADGQLSGAEQARADVPSQQSGGRNAPISDMSVARASVRFCAQLLPSTHSSI